MMTGLPDTAFRPALAALVDAVKGSRWSYVTPELGPALEVAQALLEASSEPDRPEPALPGPDDASAADPHDGIVGDRLGPAVQDPAAWKGARCSSCSRPVQWRKHAGTGNQAPIDPVPNPEGNVALVDPDLYVVLSKSDLEAARSSGDPKLYATHFQTCIYADRHRRGSRS